MSPKDPVPIHAGDDTDGIKEDYRRRRGKDADKESLYHHHHHHDYDDTDRQPTIGRCRQLAMSAGLLASDGGAVFMQLTMLPCLQALGVPVSMVTISGCLSGSMALVGLNVLGKISDGGNHPHRRKKPAVVLSALLFVIGLSLVGSGCALHMWGPHRPQMDTTDPNFIARNLRPSRNETNPSALPRGVLPADSEPSRLLPGHASIADTGEEPSLPENANITDTREVTPDTFTSSEVRLPAASDWMDDPLGLGIPLAGLLSILGFVFLDMGNDFSNSCLRSFVFASTAREQHVSLLVMGVLMSAAGGCVAAVLGLFDVGVLLTDGKEVGSVPAKTLMQSAFFVILFFICTLSSILSAPPIRLHAATGIESSLRASMLPRQSDYGSMQNDSWKSSIIYAASLLDISTESSDFGAGRHSETEQTFVQETDEDGHSSSQRTDFGSFVGPPHLTESETSGSVTPSDSQDTIRLLKANDELENRPLHRSDQKRFSPVALLRTFKGICTSSTITNSQKQTPLSSTKFSYLHDAADGASSERCRCMTGTTQKLVLICTSMFFMAGAWQAFNTCMTDYLGKVLYGGNPEADANSQSYKAYQKGMRTGSFGVLLLNVAYVIANLLQRQLLAVAGPKAEHLVVCTAQVGLLMTLQFTDNVIAFFVTAVVTGVFRSAMYTIPFMLANEICQKEAQSWTGKDSAKVGSTMALVTSMIPLSYVFVSSLTGPLMQATGDPASPIYYATACTFMAAVVFAFT